MRITPLLACVILLGVPSNSMAQISMPDITLSDLNGEAHNMQTVCSQHTTTIVALWATWCEPCKNQLDASAELYPDWRQVYDTHFVAVSIDTRRQVPKIAPMFQAKGWEYFGLIDPDGKLQNALGSNATPHLLLFDKHCTKIYEHTGFQPGDELELDDVLRSNADTE